MNSHQLYMIVFQHSSVTLVCTGTKHSSICPKGLRISGMVNWESIWRQLNVQEYPKISRYIRKSLTLGVYGSIWKYPEMFVSGEFTEINGNGPNTQYPIICSYQTFDIKFLASQAVIKSTVSRSMIYVVSGSTYSTFYVGIG